jgi:hypothetical protein
MASCRLFVISSSKMQPPYFHYYIVVLARIGNLNVGTRPDQPESGTIG